MNNNVRKCLECWVSQRYIFQIIQIKQKKMEKNINLTLSKSKTQDEKNRHKVGENIYTAPIHRAHINDKYSAHTELSTLNYMKLILNLV